jgi:hypothetical protein
VPGVGGADVAAAVGDGEADVSDRSSRPAANTATEPTVSTTAKAATPRRRALRVKSSMDMRRG